jgi:hypothetical protein
MIANMATTNMESVQAISAIAPDRVLTVMREALEQQRLCDPSLDVDATLSHAIAHPDESVVDSFASAEVLSALDEVFGDALPKEILNHRSLTTLSGLRRSLLIIGRRQGKKPPQGTP